MNIKLPDPDPALLAFARALLPDCTEVGGADQYTVHYAEELLASLAPSLRKPWIAAQRTLSYLAFAQTGRRLESMSSAQLESCVTKWSASASLGGLIHALGAVYKIAHFDRMDLRGGLRSPLAEIRNEARARWQHNVFSAESLEEELECDVVVVGTGAGGAVVGRELVAKGYAVVFAEEGDLKGRADFPGSLLGALSQLYDTNLTWGSVPMLIPRGRLVGGSTAVNGGSTFRPPRWVTQRWAMEFGSADFSMEGLLPYFEQVEQRLQVGPPSERAAGPFHELFKTGCERLGWQHELVRRNAPGCTGEGFCDSGCRSGSRRSTDVSYIPSALDQGGVLVTGLKVEEVLTQGGRACGVRGTARGEDGEAKPVRIRARAVVLAAGAFATPQLLLKQGLSNRSGQVGRNLTVHPSGASMGLYDTKIDGGSYIPQAEYTSQFLHEGLLLLSAQPDDTTFPSILPFVGEEFMRAVQQRKHIAGLGFLAADARPGRMRLNAQGRPVVSYQLKKCDVPRLKRAQALLAELFLESGAKEVYPHLTLPMTLKSQKDLRAFREMSLRPSQFVLAAFHPLGTCRMSPDAKRGVVNAHHESHEVSRLFVVDGSVVSGPIGVNPQLTIMALAARAAEKIHQLIDE